VGRAIRETSENVTLESCSEMRDSLYHVTMTSNSVSSGMRECELNSSGLGYGPMAKVIILVQ
jgi:hypothetical protein